MTWTDPETSNELKARLREEARNWLVILLDQPTKSQEMEFDRWLKASPDHVDAYSAAEATLLSTELAGQKLAMAHTQRLNGYLAAMDKAKKGRVSRRAFSTLAVVCLVLVTGAVWFERPGLIQDMRADQYTQRGERRAVELADGTTILLDADSAINIDVDNGKRTVRLLRGGAFFDVASTGQQFVVETDGGDVTVLGTRFEVRLVDDTSVVTLEEGRVSVRASEVASNTILEPGQQLRFTATALGAAEAVKVDQALAWRDGKLVFHRARLSDVVGEIARYRPGRIIIATAALKGELVTGSLSLKDTDAALQSLASSVGFKVRNLAGRLTVIGF